MWAEVVLAVGGSVDKSACGPPLDSSLMLWKTRGRRR